MSRPSQQVKSIGVVAAGLLLVAACGCGSDGREQYDVSGTVSFGGQPVPAGVVLFEPDLAAGNDGTQGYAEIHNGRFDTSASGKRVTGGKYIVRVRGFVPDAGGDRPQVLFHEYRQPLELPKQSTEQQIVVPQSASARGEALPDAT